MLHCKWQPFPCVFLRLALAFFSYAFLQPFGVSYSGATYKYTVIDTTGQRAAAAGMSAAYAFI